MKFKTLTSLVGVFAVAFSPAQAEVIDTESLADGEYYKFVPLKDLIEHALDGRRLRGQFPMVKYDPEADHRELIRQSRITKEEAERFLDDSAFCICGENSDNTLTYAADGTCECCYFKDTSNNCNADNEAPSDIDIQTFPPSFRPGNRALKHQSIAIYDKEERGFHLVQPSSEVFQRHFQ